MKSEGFFLLVGTYQYYRYLTDANYLVVSTWIRYSNCWGSMMCGRLVTHTVEVVGGHVILQRHFNLIEEQRLALWSQWSNLASWMIFRRAR